MKKVVQAVLSQGADVERATIPYVDDLCVDENIVTADRAVEHFSRYGLECKPPERVQNGTRPGSASLESQRTVISIGLGIMQSVPLLTS